MSGGSAMYHGANYQAAIGAFFGALAVAESTNRIPPEVPQTAPPVRVGAEQSWAVDDLAVWFGSHSMAWIQAKASLNASGLPDVIGQMVRNFVHGRERVPGTPLLRDDRLLLAVGSTSQWIAEDLRELLIRVGKLDVDDGIEAAVQEPGPVKDAYDAVAPMVREALEAAGNPYDDTAVRRVLASARIWPISEDELQRLTIGLLDPFVVEDPTQANAALAVLCQQFSQAAQHRTVHDVRELRALLSHAGIRLRAPRGVASDVKLLEAQTDRVIVVETAARALRTRDGEIHIERTVTDEVARELALGNIVLTGEAGAGKSGVLLEGAARLRSVDERVVFLDATDPAMRDPRAALGLTHQLGEVLERWDNPNRPAYLFIDGFDAIRLGESLGPLVRLIRALGVAGANWRIAIASREYDLLNAPELRELFPYDPAQHVPEALRDVKRFGRVAHIFVRGLDERELTVIGARSSSLGELLAAAPRDVQKLLRNPFNLSVAASLTVDSSGVADLSRVRNRIDLLDMWWEQRLQRGSAAMQKERLLKTVAERMIAERQLRVSTDVLPGDAASKELLSEAVLVTQGRRQRQVAYGHAIVFDYVVDRLLLDTEGAMAALLGADRDAFLFVLPSIRMRFAELWQDDRPAFYRELATLFAQRSQRRTLLMVAASIPVEHLERADDLVPLLDAKNEASLAAVRFVVRALIHTREQGRAVVSGTAQPWADVVLTMARRLPRHEHDTLLLLHELLSAPGATAAQFTAIGNAARLCLTQQLDRDPHDPRLMRMAIESFAKSYDADSAAARPLLDRLLDPARIARVGQFEIEPLARYADRMRDPDALEALYAGAFADISVPEGQIPVGNPSVIFGLVQDSRQTLSHARWALGQRFAAFLADHPRAAVRAFCRVIDRKANSPHRSRELSVRFGAIRLRLLLDSSYSWDDDLYQQDDWRVMSVAFETRLRDGIAAGDEFFMAALDELVQHGRALYLWRVLVRNCGGSDAAAAAVAMFVAQRAVLLTHELGEPIAEYLTNGYVRLPIETRREIDAAILAVLEEETDADLRGYREKRVREYAASIPATEIATPRFAAMAPTDDNTPPDAAAYRRRMTLSGFARSDVTNTQPRVSEAAVNVGAPAELIAAIDAVQPVLDASANVSTDRDPSLIAPAVRRIDELSRGAATTIRIQALDIIACLIRTGLDWDAFGPEARAEFLPLALEAVAVEEPTPEGGDREVSERSDGHISWGSPNAVADGVQALWRLYRHGHDDRIVAAIQRLTRHPRSNIRFLAVSEAGRLRDVDPDTVWEIAERAAGDRAIGVVSAGINTANMVAHLDFDRMRRITFTAYDRFVIANPKSDFARGLLAWVIRRTLMGDGEAAERLEPILAGPWVHAEIAEPVIFILANRLVGTAPIEDRLSASRVLISLVERLLARAEQLATQHGFDATTYPPSEHTEAAACLKLLSEVAERIYYASGVMQQNRPTGLLEDTGAIDAEQLTVLRPLLQLLARFTFSRTAYYVVKTLQGAVETDPRGVLMLGIDAIRSGVRGGLADDGMAEDDVRAFVVRYIEGYRGLLESHRECLGAVMDVVDAFVDAGWPRWIDVIFQLDQIYRGD